MQLEQKLCLFCSQYLLAHECVIKTLAEHCIISAFIVYKNSKEGFLLFACTQLLEEQSQVDVRSHPFEEASLVYVKAFRQLVIEPPNEAKLEPFKQWTQDHYWMKLFFGWKGWPLLVKRNQSSFETALHVHECVWSPEIAQQVRARGMEHSGVIYSIESERLTAGTVVLQTFDLRLRLRQWREHRKSPLLGMGWWSYVLLRKSFVVTVDSMEGLFPAL